MVGSYQIFNHPSLLRFRRRLSRSCFLLLRSSRRFRANVASNFATEIIGGSVGFVFGVAVPVGGAPELGIPPGLPTLEISALSRACGSSTGIKLSKSKRGSTPSPPGPSIGMSMPSNDIPPPGVPSGIFESTTVEGSPLLGVSTTWFTGVMVGCIGTRSISVSGMPAPNGSPTLGDSPFGFTRRIGGCPLFRPERCRDRDLDLDLDLDLDRERERERDLCLFLRRLLRPSLIPNGSSTLGN